MIPTSVTGLPLRHICVAIGVGVILSLFILALTTPQTMTTQYSPEITSVSTPEPVYVEETPEPDVNAQENNPMTPPVNELISDLFMVLILCAVLICVVSIIFNLL